jgi:dihydroneopterin aldolase
MDKIYLKNIKIYAYHGCMEEEKKIGSDYLVNLIVHADLSLSCESDELKDTVDYVALLDIVKSQMKMRANLLENVADRVVNKIISKFPSVKKAVVKISKLNPPINGNIDEVVIRREKKREKTKID